MNELLKKAQEAIERGEYDAAVGLLRGPADSGSADAQYLLGYLYFTSADVDRVESRQWLELAAAQQHADALFCLSNWHEDNTVRPPDSERRRAQLLRAAELGSLRAQRDLGCYYAIGEAGFPLDPVLGRLWYSRAAERGHADAQYNYGRMMIHGEGGPSDPIGGLEWIRLSAAQNDPAALHFLATLNDFGQEVTEGKSKY